MVAPCKLIYFWSSSKRQIWKISQKVPGLHWQYNRSKSSDERRVRQTDALAKLFFKSEWIARGQEIDEKFFWKVQYDQQNLSRSTSRDHHQNQKSSKDLIQSCNIWSERVKRKS